MDEFLAPPLPELEGPAGAVLARITVEATAAIRSGRRVGILAAASAIAACMDSMLLVTSSAGSVAASSGVTATRYFGFRRT